MAQPPVDPHQEPQSSSGTPPHPAAPHAPAPGYNEGQIPYDAYPAPSGGVFEQAGHESIAPVDPGYGLAPDYQVPPPGPQGNAADAVPGPAGQYGLTTQHHPPVGGQPMDPTSAGAPSAGDPYGLTPHDQPQGTEQGFATGSQQGFGTEQYGSELYGSEQYGSEPAHGTEQAYGAEQYGTEQYGTEQYGTEQYGTEQYGTEQAYGVEVDGFGWTPSGTPGAVPSPTPAPSSPGVRPAGAGVLRYAQLSYTSFDRPGERGGWQVKQVQGDLDETETALLRDAVQTQFDSGVDLPKFPTAQDIARFPRRLLHAPLGDRASAMWHTAPAGSDASGRPGNVFAHVLLDRDRSSADRDGTGLGRPIQLWRSTDWRTPYGADEVRATDLPDVLPRPNHGASTGAIVGFLTDPEAWRLATFTVLLDACAQAMAGGPPVVLLVDNVDRGAQWIAAVSRMMAPEQSRDLFFSTLERPHGLASAFAHQVRLACAPVADQEVIVRERSALGCVVIAESEVVQIGDVGGAHRTASGDEIPVTSWFGLVTAVLADPERAVATLRQADRLAAAGSEAGADPLWSLALAVARQAEDHPDALADAATILASGAPGTVLDDPQTEAEVTALVRGHLGTSTADAWQVCSAATRPAPVAVRLYAHRAIGDVEWLTRSEGVPVPDGADLGGDPTLLDRARTMARDLRDMADADPRTVSVAALRMADLLAALGLSDEETTTTLQDLTDRVVLRQLASDTHGMVGAVGPLQPATRSLLVTALEGDDSWTHAAPGARLPAELLRWVLDDPGPAPVPQDRDLTATRRLRGELAVQRWRHGDARELQLAGWLALAEDNEPLKADLFDQVVWPVEQLSPLQGIFEDRMPPNGWLATLKAAEGDTPLFQQICAWFGGGQWQSGQPAASPLAAVAELRSLQPGWVRLEHRAAAVTAAVNGAAAGQFAAPTVQFAPAAAHDVQLAVVLAVADPALVADLGTEQRLESLRTLFTDHDLSVDADFVADVASHVATLEMSEVVGRVAAADPRFTLDLTGAAARIRWLDRLTGPDGQPVLREALRSALGEHPDRKEITRWAREGVQRPGEDPRTVDRLVTEWVTDVVGADESRRRGLFRGGQ